jgi:hypothetical protein
MAIRRLCVVMEWLLFVPLQFVGVSFNNDVRIDLLRRLAVRWYEKAFILRNEILGDAVPGKQGRSALEGSLRHRVTLIGVGQELQDCVR